MARAYVLAGGLGTRLQGRIGDLPKALAPFAGRPFLDAQLEWRAAGGVAEALRRAGAQLVPVAFSTTGAVAWSAPRG